MKKIILLAAASALVTPALAAPAAPDAARLKATVERLVSFGTRHTLSSATDPRRGIGAARAWGKAEFEKIGKGCGGCLTVETVADRFTGPRAPEGATAVDGWLAVDERGLRAPWRRGLRLANLFGEQALFLLSRKG